MKTKFILVASIAACSFVFAQTTPSKLVPGKNGLHAEFMRFEKMHLHFRAAQFYLTKHLRDFLPGKLVNWA
ncbi:hypothetical protein BOQ62_06820 [Chryseobacterium sp. CH21]|uniref:hypothetical protein n=1 Tax=Chryseobacterium sp. CH21 TaxID=713556 RepID=UPI00100B105D|nr:hypothetical protein [Chryseobacterium sp. CH21]RXM40404.1 hypothetical protein BOQ62_06820 [Chryseobacterium sp. CH21]